MQLKKLLSTPTEKVSNVKKVLKTPHFATAFLKLTVHSGMLEASRSSISIDMCLT